MLTVVNDVAIDRTVRGWAGDSHALESVFCCDFQIHDRQMRLLLGVYITVFSKCCCYCSLRGDFQHYSVSNYLILGCADVR